MNKKELSEIRKNFSESADLLVIERVATAFVDAQGAIRCSEVRPFHMIAVEEAGVLISTLKRTLSGTLGKALVEYEFPNEAYEEGGAQTIIYDALQTKLQNEDALRVFFDHIAKNYEYLSTYAIITAYATYTVFKKTKDDEIDPYQGHEYHFLLTALCPVEIREDGLIYNEDENCIQKKPVNDRVVAEVPSDGFLYPTFTGRGPDVNHVLCFAHKPKEVNISLIEKVLGCTFTQTAQEQKNAFLEMMQEVVGDELSYAVITGVNEKIRDIAAEYASDPELPVIDDIHMRDILLDSGVSEEKAMQMQQVYREATQNKPITANNLVENKTTISFDGVSVQIGRDSEDKVRTQIVDGRRYLLIDLDDPAVEINGLTARVTQETEPEEIPFD